MVNTTEDDYEGDVATYWSEYLGKNGRALYGAAAKVELSDGPGYTLKGIADAMGVSYESAQSIHRTTGRTAKAVGRTRRRRDAHPARLDGLRLEP